MISRFKTSFLIVFYVFSFCLATSLSQAEEKSTPKSAPTADNESCFACHSDKDSAPYIDEATFKASKHGGEFCITCHDDLANTDFPHKSPVNPVNCGTCHTDEDAQFVDSLHGKALAKGDKLAPRCQNCHGSHDIVSVKNNNSKVSPLKIPFVCGSCHSEGLPVQVQREIHQDHILENYSESIHGEGLLKKGLNVTATCASCHNAHQILPHTDPRSSISRKNIVQGCLKCHAQIEQVHRKIIKGELWEKSPETIPVCVDCHQPHKARKVFYDQGVADNDCLTCHAKKDIVASKDGHSLFVDGQEHKRSIHTKISCSQCHTEVSTSKVRACETITKKVDCASCHNSQGEMYQRSIHGKSYVKDNQETPTCKDCHGTHAVLSKKNTSSPIYSTNIPALCARCHQEKGTATARYTGTEHDVVNHYIESIHGKGLLKSGLVVTATCTSCHTAHLELPANDPASSVHRNNIAGTCAQCHIGVYEKYKQSVHATGKPGNHDKLPVCYDCHTAHTIKRADKDNFKSEIMDVCGKCHLDIAKTYFQTFHGKVVKLGYEKAAKCADCHGSHEIFPVDDTRSTLSHENITQTCQKCHVGATRQFAGYLTHATHHDSKKYPWIFWTFWFMTGLLAGTFTFFTIHTLLWLPKSYEMRRLHPPKPYDLTEKQYVRFPVFYRILHVLMIISFLTLTITGMTLKFSYMKWATVLSSWIGGFEVSGFLHRAAAILLFGIFFAHITDLIRRKSTEFGSWKEIVIGPNTILFTLRDVREFVATIKWYLGKGARPQYGRWTYWEKFDYMAVFWGVTVIGTSGLMLWFPEVFTRFLPGWVINVATIIHSDEALLAAGFIFTIHFFNTHFRPEKFPMDTAIFTGRTSLEELKHERPDEYKALVARNELEKHLADPLPAHTVKILKIFGWCALSIGLILVVCIIYAMLFGYK
ncbi:MAG: hypothetical protein HQL21_00410 [Candidatus Omnitrophica bacterium]|nr:hypothetical protein [Candidatus Omnitrophota bacterium]